MGSTRRRAETTGVATSGPTLWFAFETALMPSRYLALQVSTPDHQETRSLARVMSTLLAVTLTPGPQGSLSEGTEYISMIRLKHETGNSKSGQDKSN